MNIPEKMMSEIYSQAEEEYPNECCGMILGPASRPEAATRLRPCRNVYDEYHAKDPENFPRTAGKAYFIDPRELLAIQKETRGNRETVRIIYHSHIDAGAYFSDEDHRVAAPDGEPSYPGVEYLVVSVQQGKVKEHNLFRWNPEQRKYIS